MLVFWSPLACQREPRESKGNKIPTLPLGQPSLQSPFQHLFSSWLPCPSPNRPKVFPTRTPNYFAWTNLHIVGKKYFTLHVQPFGFLCLGHGEPCLTIRRFAEQTAVFSFCQLQVKKSDSVYDESKERVGGTVIRVTLTVSNTFWTFTIHRAPYKPFTYIILFDPYNKPLGYVLLESSSPLYRWANWVF